MTVGLFVYQGSRRVYPLPDDLSGPGDRTEEQGTTQDPGCKQGEKGQYYIIGGGYRQVLLVFIIELKVAQCRHKGHM